MLRYFSGTLRLMAGKADGLQQLDLSADGFWNSFAAILVALPPTAVAWVQFETSRQIAGTPGRGTLGLYVAYALADLTAWLFPVLVLFLAARPLHLTRRFAALIVSMNWTNACLAWASLPVWLLLLATGAPAAGAGLMALLLLAVSVALTVRVVATATGKDMPNAAAIVGLSIVCAMMAYAAVADLTGLAPA